MAIAKLRVGDSVKVIAGKAKNAVGRIIKIQGSFVYVENVNLVVKSVKKKQGEDSQQHQGFKKVEAPIHRSNVAFYDNAQSKAVKVAIKEIDGKRVRVDRKTGVPFTQVEVQ